MVNEKRKQFTAGHVTFPFAPEVWILPLHSLLHSKICKISHSPGVQPHTSKTMFASASNTLVTGGNFVVHQRGVAGAPKE